MSIPANTTNTITIKYAPYIEEHHKGFLDYISAHNEIALANNPYNLYADIDINPAAFSIGYEISDFPVLYEMYGKHMSGMDVEIVYDSTFSKIINSSEIANNINEDKVTLTDSIIKTELFNYMLEMRNINAVISSSFIIGKANIESKRLKDIEKLSLDYRMNNVKDVQVKFNEQLDFSRKVITSYAECMKKYYVMRLMTSERNETLKSRKELWSLEVLDFKQNALGALVRAASYQKIVGFNRERSDLSKALSIASATVTGATIGAQVGGGYGALGGAVIGFKVGITQMLLESSDYNWVTAALVWAVF